MSSLELTSVDVFVIAIGLLFGYLVMSHLLGPQKGDAGDSNIPPGVGPSGRAEAPTEPPPEFSAPSWERVLGVSRYYASPEQVRQAYRTQIAKYHPDKVAALGDEFKVIAVRRSQEINAAYAAACRDKGVS
jgi:DnaJ like chaperone protein